MNLEEVIKAADPHIGIPPKFVPHADEEQAQAKDHLLNLKDQAYRDAVGLMAVTNSQLRKALLQILHYDRKGKGDCEMWDEIKEICTNALLQ